MYLLFICIFFFFFFKQKTAYEMQRGLVGSEMCIRDSYWGNPKDSAAEHKAKGTMRVPDIREIREGLVHSKLNDKKAPNRSKCTFSIVSKDRTLELECPTIVQFYLKDIGLSLIHI
eukprot:TRINITY_DN7759_c0_g1_i1.p3 TRINITY_DN7759_c0_g1~~TRINITY_DN7759_c0_g1_i1.p3  ORF type:complete len:116 (+),score=29.24 TRINITY_DN7759_c0_g1_i1:101-448(+)